MISHSPQKGFTIIELMVSVAIFALMTAFLVAKYGNFNQSILLVNQAYDVALTIRNAQTYGLNVKSRPIPDPSGAPSQYSSDFTSGYGVHFDKTTGTPRTKMIFFADIDGDKLYDADEMLYTYTLRNGSYIYDICSGSIEQTCTPVATPPGTFDILFKRPNPDTLFADSNVRYALITLRSSSGGEKKIAVRKTGQIAVLQH